MKKNKEMENRSNFCKYPSSWPDIIEKTNFFEEIDIIFVNNHILVSEKHQWDLQNNHHHEITVPWPLMMRGGR